ncbi:MAG: GTP pyrophosphokinase [Segniliparus sp.]|uniref:GTP pyrophosphokinase n=1 Tax=Segniliparus sp. TaxID=2804064 RepID=UPI003F2A1151
MEIFANHVELYSQRRDLYVKAAKKLRQVLTECMEEASITYLVVKSRAKEVASFEKKSTKESADGSLKYSDPLTEITDLVAARIVTYSEASVEDVCAIIGQKFFLDESADKGKETRDKGEFGYASKHFVAKLLPTYFGIPGYKILEDMRFEIQVRTAVQHAWAEYEHSVRYKGGFPKGANPEIDRGFEAAAVDAERLDREFAEIGRVVREASSGVSQGEKIPTSSSKGNSFARTWLTGASLRSFLEQRYSGVGPSKRMSYDWISGLLVLHGIDSIEELSATLQDVNHELVAQAMGYSYPAMHVRRLDDDLLQSLGQGWIERYKREVPEGKEHLSHLRARRRMLQNAGLWRG